MPSELLKCTVCPKATVKFSDTSHLLTHVGSKGHLAQLHRLQVKSHQDLESGHRLTIYNQWFHEHGIAGMLSERMQLKEQKRGYKKVITNARTDQNKTGGKGRGRKPQQPPPFSAYETQSSVDNTQVLTSNTNEVIYTPVPPRRRGRYPALETSPPKVLSSQSVDEEEDDYAADGQKVRPAPGTPQLKGTQYPGMNLFDAAPEELKRKRNQKKDGSVLKNLERNATLVKPTETVQSAAGVVLKRRHMDDLENDSPVEGEEPIVELSPDKRKSTGLRVKRQQRGPKRPRAKSGRTRREITTPSKLLSSSIVDLSRSYSRFLPTDGENQEFKRTLRNMGKRKKKQNFTVYQDSSPSFNVDGSSETLAHAYVDANTAKQQPSFPAPAWHGQHATTYDPFKLVRERFAGYSSFPDLAQGTENAAVESLGSNHDSQSHATINPLFSSDETIHASNFGSSHVRSNVGMMVNMDPFGDSETMMTARNPLMAAFEHMHKNSVKGEDFTFDHAEVVDFSTQYRQPMFAP